MSGFSVYGIAFFTGVLLQAAKVTAPRPKPKYFKKSLRFALVESSFAKTLSKGSPSENSLALEVTNSCVCSNSSTPFQYLFEDMIRFFL